MDKQKVKTRVDLTGMLFGRLIVLEQAEDFIDKYGIHKAVWKCRCSCEKQTIVNVAQTSLKSGATVSCGCFGKKQRKNSKIKHGKKGTRIYNVWQNIKSRCFTKTNPSYQYYGGRGIVMCKEWVNDFECFYNWAIYNGYNDNLTIERIDNNKNYEPNNCKWATWEEQSLNKRDTHILEYKGIKKPLTIWARELGINPSTLLYRLKRGWSIERAVETKVVKNGTKR